MTGELIGQRPLAAAGLLVCLAVCVAASLRAEPRAGRRLQASDVVGVLLLALALRAAFMFVQDGAVHDMTSYRIVGEQLRHGVDAFVPPALDRQNYPPLMVWWSALVATLAPGGGHLFAMLEKSLFCAGDAAVAVSLLWIAPVAWRRRAALLYALNPVAITVCALHGQFDAMVILPLLWSLHLLQRSPGRAGLLAGVALAVKIWPLLFAPVVLLRMRGRGAARYAGAALLAPLTVFAAYALVHPHHLLAGVVRMLSYGGVPTPLGLGFLVDWPAPAATALNIVLLSGAGLVAWRLRHANVHVAFAACACLLIGLSPTVSSQYLVWPVALLLASTRPRAAVVYTAAVLPALSILALWGELGGLVSPALYLLPWLLACVGPLAVALTISGRPRASTSLVGRLGWSL